MQNEFALSIHVTPNSAGQEIDHCQHHSNPEMDFLKKDFQRTVDPSSQANRQ